MNNNSNKMAKLALVFLCAAEAAFLYAAVTDADPLNIKNNPTEETCNDVKCVDVNAEPVDACEKIKCVDFQDGSEYTPKNI